MTVAMLEMWLRGSEDHASGAGGSRPGANDGPGARGAPVDDRTLIQRIRDGNSLAFDALALRHIPALVRFAGAILGDRDAAEDVVQTVLARLWERREQLVLDGAVVAYLCAMVRNQALDAKRRDLARSRASHAVGASLSASFPVPDAIGESEHMRGVRVAFFTLPEHYRAVLQLRYGQRFGYTEIASALELTPKGAERLLARALAALRRALGVA